MPKRRTEDVVHVVMTDHLIQRRPPSQDPVPERAERHLNESEEYHGEVIPYYPSTFPREGPDALYRALAQVAMKNNLRPGVGELARLLALQGPREAEWYIQLGNGWLASGEPGKAVAAYERAVRLRPRNVRALQSLARGLKASGKSLRSAGILQQAIQIAPSDAASWYQSAVLALELGQAGEALGKMQKAVALDPDLPGEYTTLARIQAASGQALSDFEKAIRYRPNFAPHLYDYALALSSTGQFDRAQESAKAAARADPTLPEVHVLLGGLLARQRRLPDAAGEYQEALRLRPDFGRTRLDLASVLVALGDTPGAAQQLREAAKSSDLEVARVAARALQQLGQR
jgi:tetratricopeptide (TPR) repeat protein